MEPREYKRLAEILLAIGVVLAVLGLVFIYVAEMGTAGAIILILGCACALLSLPTFMILTIITNYRK